MTRPPQITEGVGTTGAMICEQHRKLQRRGCVINGAIRQVTPHVAIDVVAQTYENLGEEFEPLDATTVAALKRAMRMDPALHHVADAIDGVPDGDVQDGHRGNMAIGFGNLQLRLQHIGAKHARALSESRDVGLIQRAADGGLSIDNALPTSVIYVASAEGSTGTNTDLLALQGLAQARLSGATVEQKALFIGAGMQQGINGAQRLGNMLALMLKIDAYQSMPQHIFGPRYGRGAIQLNAGERLFRQCRFISPAGQSAVSNREKMCEVAALVVEYDHDYSSAADAFFQNSEDDFFAEGRHWSTVGIASLTYSPDSYRRALLFYGEAALADRLLAGSGEAEAPSFGGLVTAARGKLDKLSMSFNASSLKKTLTDGLLKIGAAKTRYLPRTITNIEFEFAAQQGEQNQKFQKHANNLLDEFVKEIRQQTAGASAKNGVAATIQGLEVLHKALVAGNYRPPPSTTASKPHKTYLDHHETIGAQFNQAMNTMLKVGARDLAGEAIKAKLGVVLSEMNNMHESLCGELHLGFACAVQSHIDRLKESQEQMSAVKANAETARHAIKNTDVFGIGRRLPTADQLTASAEQIWTQDRLAPLVRLVASKSDATSLGQEISDAVQNAMGEYASIPEDLATFMATLPDEDVRRLLMELKTNSRELAGLELDAVKPGRVPMRHVTILMPHGDSQLHTLAGEIMKANHTGFHTSQWDHPNEMRVVSEQRGVFLAEFREITSAENEIGGISSEFWDGRPVLFADQKRILNHRADKPHDIRSAEQVLSGGIWVGEIIKTGAQEYKPNRAALGERMGLRPGQSIGRGLADTLEFLATNDNTRRAIQEAIDRAKGGLGAEETINQLRYAHVNAAKLVPATFVDKFRACIEREMEAMPANHGLVSAMGRLGKDSNGNGHGNNDDEAAGSADRR